MTQLLRNITYRAKRSIVKVLNSPGSSSTTNWKALIGVMPDGFYTTIDVEQFEQDYMKMHTSPADTLISDLCRRHVTVDEFKCWLSEIGNEEALEALRPLPTAPPLEG